MANGNNVAHLNVLYQSLRDSVVNITNLSTTANFSLSHEQRILLNVYIHIYNTTMRQIDLLYTDIDVDNSANIVEPPPPITSHVPAAAPQRSRDIMQELLVETLRGFYNPVNVVATPQQIATATRNVVFGLVEDPPNTSCPICLDVFEHNSIVTEIIHCGHVFVPNELSRWFETNVRCPVCRHDIRNSNNNGATLIFDAIFRA